MARDFVESQGLASPVWTDPRRESYRHLGFVRSWKALLDPRTFRFGLRAFRKGFRQGPTQGDPHQQGGVLVVEAGGKPVYGYASEVPGDMPPTEEVLAAARRAAKGSRK
jgi:hypothetical protein